MASPTVQKKVESDLYQYIQCINANTTNAPLQGLVGFQSPEFADANTMVESLEESVSLQLSDKKVCTFQATFAYNVFLYQLILHCTDESKPLKCNVIWSYNKDGEWVRACSTNFDNKPKKLFGVQTRYAYELIQHPENGGTAAKQWTVKTRRVEL